MSSNKTSIIPQIKPSDIDHFSIFKSRDFYKGKSFEFVGSWSEGKKYVNDDFVRHFVTHENTLIACNKTHISELGNNPEFIRNDGGVIVGLTTNSKKYWSFVLTGVCDSEIDLSTLESYLTKDEAATIYAPIEGNWQQTFMVADPEENNQAATKRYVDQEIRKTGLTAASGRIDGVHMDSSFDGYISIEEGYSHDQSRDIVIGVVTDGQELDNYNNRDALVGANALIDHVAQNIAAVQSHVSDVKSELQDEIDSVRDSVDLTEYYTKDEVDTIVSNMVVYSQVIDGSTWE